MHTESMKEVQLNFDCRGIKVWRAEMEVQIGKVIKELRARNKVTQEMLAEHIGVTAQAISKWEAGVI